MRKPPRSLASLQRQYEQLQADERAAVDRMLAGREAHTQIGRRNMLSDALDMVVRALACNKDCCKLLSRQERLEAL